LRSTYKVADINKDGKPDLVVLNQCGGDDGNCRFPTVGVLLGNGDGTFRPVLTSAPGGSLPGAIAIADVNGDGKPDVIVAYCNGCASTRGGVAVLLGNGDGTFQPPTTYDSGGNGTGGVTVADLNGDGKLDIIVTNQCTEYCPTGEAEGSVAVLQGNGDGTFQAAVTYDPAAYYPSSVVAADINGDGKTDLVVGSCLPNGQIDCSRQTVTILLGNGDGTLQSAVTYFAKRGGSSPLSLSVADVNEDGKLDVVVPGVFLLGNGDGTLQAPQTVASNGFGIAVADLNGDGKPDLVDSFGDVQLHVGDVATTTVLTSTPNPSVFGQETFTATVSSGSGTPTGTVFFYNQAYEAVVGSVTLTGGSATLSGATSGGGVGVGTDPIVAVYQGSVKHHPSLSSVLQQVVTKATTTTSVTSSVNPATVGAAITYAASVTSEYGAGAGGTVACLDNGSNLAAENGHPWQFKVKYTVAGTHTIACSYSGDANNLGSTAPNFTEQALYATTTTLATSGSPSHVGQPVTFTATITSKFGSVPNGELITFIASSKTLCLAPLFSGTATCTTTFSKAKTYNVRAQYSSDGTFKASSGKVVQVVSP
jgi:hypothetical protein